MGSEEDGRSNQTCAVIVPLPSAVSTLPHIGVWEIDYRKLPDPLHDESGRIDFPYVILIVDQQSYFVFKIHVAFKEDVHRAISSKLMDAILELHAAPSVIHVRKKDLLECLTPLVRDAGITVTLAKPLRALDSAVRSMKSFMKK